MEPVPQKTGSSCQFHAKIRLSGSAVVAGKTQPAAAVSRMLSTGAPKSAAILVADPMNLWNTYHRAVTVSEALHALADATGSACIIAGGTDLMLDLQQGRRAPVQTLVDISGVAELNCLEIRAGELFIGAAVPISRIARSAFVREHAQALVEACDLIGGPQVRNMATLGGNVAHALPAADGTIALSAIGAQVEIASLEGRRRLPILECFAGPGKSTLLPGQELLTGFYLPLRSAGQASAFKRVMRPQGVALPILNLAVWLEREADRLKDIQIAAGPSGPTPRRLLKTEERLRGTHLDEAALAAAVQETAKEARFRTSQHRATAAYRYHLVKNLLLDVLQVAWNRAGSAS